MTAPLCDCEGRGVCRRCKQRAYWHRWAAKHPEYRMLHPDRRWGQGRVDPRAARMDRIAEQVWARFADPSYYAPAAERFRGWGPTAGVMRVDSWT